MSLAVPKNISGRECLIDVLCDVFEQLRVPTSVHIAHGQHSSHELTHADYESTARDLAACSLVYVREGSRGYLGPVCGLVRSEELGNARVQFLIDDVPKAAKQELPRQTKEALCLYLRSIFRDCDWLELISVPVKIQEVDDSFGLAIECCDDGVTHVRLKDAGHRPWSSRRRL